MITTLPMETGKFELTRLEAVTYLILTALSACGASQVPRGEQSVDYETEQIISVADTIRSTCFNELGVTAEELPVSDAVTDSRMVGFRVVSGNELPTWTTARGDEPVNATRSKFRACLNLQAAMLGLRHKGPTRQR